MLLNHIFSFKIDFSIKDFSEDTGCRFIQSSEIHNMIKPCWIYNVTQFIYVDVSVSYSYWINILCYKRIILLTLKNTVVVWKPVCSLWLCTTYLTDLFESGHWETWEFSAPWPSLSSLNYTWSAKISFCLIFYLKTNQSL